MKYAQLIELPDLRLSKVTFYSIRLEENTRSEFADFLVRMKSQQQTLGQMGELIRIIQNIGTKYGAQKHFFRHENAASALPPPHFHYVDIEDYGVRLYCIRLSDSVVILLNGDRKTTQKAQDCPLCAKHFTLANRLARKVDEALRDRYIRLLYKELEQDDNFEILL